jgi:TatD DNase family protein
MTDTTKTAPPVAPFLRATPVDPAAPSFIDTHCHLDAAEFDADRDAVYAAAIAGGVDTLVVPAVSRDNFAAVAATCERYPGCLPAWGLHPMFVDVHRPEHLGDLRAQIEAQRPVAIGEIGLDLFVDLDYATQETFYVEQLKIAQEYDLPVLLHCRKANDEILKHLRKIKVRGGIAHAFNGSPQQADEFIKLGFKLGFGGAFTWPRANNLRRLAVDLPLEAIVLETDSPDIPPVWIGRGRNAPGELPRIAQILAELRGLDIDQVAQATTRNARELFGLA